MSDFKPRYLVMHDYGGAPKNGERMFNPYHALVFPDGQVRYRNPANPYGQKAPHAYKLNPESVGLSYAGQVGAKPTPQALAALKAEYDRINKAYPGIKALSHGEAYNQTRGTAQQASRDGRGLDEASWRDQLRTPASPTASGGVFANLQQNREGVTTTQAAPAPTPIAARGLTSYAGLSEGKQATPTIPGATFREAGSYQGYSMVDGRMQPVAGPEPARYVIPASPNLTSDLTKANGAGFQRMQPIPSADGGIKSVVATMGQPKWAGGDPRNMTGLNRVPQAGEFLSNTYGKPDVLAGSRYDDGTTGGAVPSAQPAPQPSPTPQIANQQQPAAPQPATAEHWPMRTVAEAAPAKPEWSKPMALGAAPATTNASPPSGTSTTGKWPVTTVAEAPKAPQPYQTPTWDFSGGEQKIIWPDMAKGAATGGAQANPFAKLFKGLS